MKENKILIATAWWPKKTKYFQEYSQGICELLKAPCETEFFITTKFHDSKFGSNFLAISQCIDWALANNFTHVLILDADVILKSNEFIKMILSDKDILLTGRGHGEGLQKLPDTRESASIGWGCSLIKTVVFRNVPLQYTGDWLTPDRMWIKKARLNGYQIWCHFDIVPNILEESKNIPMSAYRQQE